MLVANAKNDHNKGLLQTCQLSNVLFCFVLISKGIKKNKEYEKSILKQKITLFWSPIKLTLNN